jgi:SHS2 domain-containing protein
MAYEWVEHTGELELRVTAASAEAVFADALAAMHELLASDGSGESAEREVTASGPDRATLLAEWLNELLYLAESERFVPERIASMKLSEGELTATVEGRHGTPSPLVKAVTYHRLELRERDGKWTGQVVLDV